MTTSIIPEFNAQSRFLFIEGPLQQLPHCCASCKRYDNPNPPVEGHLRFLDFNVEIEFFGKIFLCEDCLREVCNQLGWASESQVRRFNNIKVDLLAQVAALSEENENLRNAVGNLSSLATASVSLGSDYVASVEAGDEVIVGESDEGSDSSDASDESVGDDSGPVKQDDEQGPTDLRGDVDIDQLLADL